MTRTAVITGGTGALGRAVVERMLADRVACHVTWMYEEELVGFPHANAVTLHEVDCANERQVVELFAGLDTLDASIHLVGGFAMAAVDDTSRSDFVSMFELNAVTAFLCCRESVCKMRSGGGGRIVNVAARPGTG